MFHASEDVIRPFRAREPDGRPLSWQFVGAGTTGTLNFTLPHSGGPFEFRYLSYDRAQVAVSNVIGPSPLCDRRDTDDDLIVNVVDASTCIEHCDHT